MHFGLKANIDFKFPAKGQNVIEYESWWALASRIRIVNSRT